MIQGVAWGVPAISVASVVPAIAASLPPTLVSHGWVGMNITESPTGSGQWRVDQMSIDLSKYSSAGAAGLTISNATAGTPVSAIELTIWLPLDVTFAGASGAGWSYAGQVAPGPHPGTYGGQPFYGYRFTLADTTSTGGTFTFGADLKSVSGAPVTQWSPPYNGTSSVPFYVDTSVNYGGRLLTHSAVGRIDIY